MNFSAAFKSLCLPSKIYLVLSVIGIFVSLLSSNMIGGITLFTQIIHLVYVVFWAWVLNLICNAGYKWISWVLVLAPFIVFFLVLSSLVSEPSNRNDVVILQSM